MQASLEAEKNSVVVKQDEESYKPPVSFEDGCLAISLLADKLPGGHTVQYKVKGFPPKSFGLSWSYNC